MNSFKWLGHFTNTLPDMLWNNISKELVKHYPKVRLVLATTGLAINASSIEMAINCRPSTTLEAYILPS